MRILMISILGFSWMLPNICMADHPVTQGPVNISCAGIMETTGVTKLDAGDTAGWTYYGFHATLPTITETTSFPVYGEQHLYVHSSEDGSILSSESGRAQLNVWSKGRKQLHVGLYLDKKTGDAGIIPTYVQISLDSNPFVGKGSFILPGGLTAEANCRIEYLPMAKP